MTEAVTPNEAVSRLIDAIHNIRPHLDALAQRIADYDDQEAFASLTLLSSTATELADDALGIAAAS